MPAWPYEQASDFPAKIGLIEIGMQKHGGYPPPCVEFHHQNVRRVHLVIWWNWFVLFIW
jgi:hypothetical protein